MIITIDGPSGTGKSTVAQTLAKDLNYTYLDTGAMYRCAAFYLQTTGVDLSDENRIAAVLRHFEFAVKEVGGGKRYFVNGENVTDQIRSEEISRLASRISTFSAVREKMVKLQRSEAKNRNIVCEGRDMGTVVFPSAELKIYLTADDRVRAKRRQQQLNEKFPEELHDFDSILADMRSRDERDMQRKHSPLKKAKGAYEIDTSELNTKEVLDRCVDLYLKVAKRIHSTRTAWMRFRNMHILYRTVLFFSWILLKLLYRFRVYGLENFIQGRAIIAPNHASYLDPPAVAVAAAEEIHFLAKEPLFRPPVFGQIIKRLNSHPVTGEVGDAKVFKLCVKLLQQDRKVIIFPEGSRSDDGFLQPIKPGIGLLARSANAPIIPAYIDGAFAVWHRHQKVPKFRGKISVAFGTPIFYREFAHMGRRDGNAAIAKRLSIALLDLKNWIEAGAKGSPP